MKHGTPSILEPAAHAQTNFDRTPGTLVPDKNLVGVADTRNIIFDPAAVITGLEVRLNLTGPGQGNWTLFLADNAAADTSTLAGWGLTIHSEICPFSIWDSNGDSANTVTVDAGVTTSIHSVIDGGDGMTKAGSGALVITGANTLDGNFLLNQGTLRIANTTGSATGSGGLVTALGTTLEGDGIIVPTGTASINVSGQISPGSSIGTLTFDLSATSGSLHMETGSGFVFELGTGNEAIDSIGLNSSDTIGILGGGPGDVAFNGNVIDFGFTGNNGFYKLFDTDTGNAELWSGLIYDFQSGLVSSGLTYVNLASDRTGQFIVGTAGNGGDAGDIYLHVIPEPEAAFIGSIGMFFLLRRRR